MSSTNSQPHKFTTRWKMDSHETEEDKNTDVWLMKSIEDSGLICSHFWTLYFSQSRPWCISPKQELIFTERLLYPEPGTEEER